MLDQEPDVTTYFYEVPYGATADTVMVTTDPQEMGALLALSPSGVVCTDPSTISSVSVIVFGERAQEMSWGQIKNVYHDSKDDH